MVVLEILSGGNAGTEARIDRFPCLLGRSPAADLRIEEPGVWDRHLELSWDSQEGIIATIPAPAIASLNQQRFERARLHPGDIIDCGSLKLRFRLSEAAVRKQWPREWLTWMGLLLLFLLQLFLMNQLPN